ncbi:Spaf_1101 family AAA-like ATPase [Lacticaseibacillus daqingensis]|uniref:Spaf_1101 family AAA-like ATPase n=1 Tax=Lacticaseibacillus daqingensis TaxID=2486014 RepID=UPI00384D8E77
MHVVGIADNSTKSKRRVAKFIADNILSVKSGTYLTSWEVIEWFRERGFISYVAHINTSDVFKSDYGSGAYKERLFSVKNMQVVGISNVLTKQATLQRLHNHKVEEPAVFLDEDSHSLDELATNTFWVKGQEPDFNMLRNAIEDSDISLKFDRPELPSVFIKSVSIDGDGFLGKGGSPFSVSFSTALNCIIGGRGTGKSTLLDCVSFVLSQHVRDLAQLKNICKQGRISLTLSVDGKVYYVVFNPAIEGVREDAFIRGYLFGEEHQLQYSDRMEDQFDEEKITKATQGKIQIFSLHDDAIFEVSEKKKFFNRVFRSSYSVNELVKKASDRHITSFIESQLNSTSMKVSKIRTATIENDKQLREQAGRVKTTLKNHKAAIVEKIARINSESNRVRVTYTQKPLSSQYFDWSRQFDPDLFKTSKRWFQNYNIDADGLMDLFDKGSDEFGIIGLYLLVRNEDVEKLGPLLLSLTTPVGTREIDNSIKEITTENIKEVLGKIKDKIVRPTRFHIYDLLNQYYRSVDQFDLEFDINSSENDSQTTVFKSISEISLGQKVVALLDFIFMFGAVSGDVTPLLLDQPEDNLDSTYIYRHLVESLRRQKDHRQVLIVTHNSTIVTNSKPEQVISLKSDNKHGWVENTGYPTEAEVVLQIVNLLEGGVASFKHKEFVYSPIIGSVSNGAPSHGK